VNQNVFCARLKQELPGLAAPPWPGPVGEIIFKNVCEESWQEWLEAEIKIINEERLDLSEEPARLRLYNAMIEFLNLHELV
jgi:Fe-S cluster biosynthesis and repair protein YggX